MPGRLPRATGSEIVRALRQKGWEVVVQVGSHVQLKHPAMPGRVTVPVHRGKIVKPGTLGNILRQAGLTADELRELLSETLWLPQPTRQRCASTPSY